MKDRKVKQVYGGWVPVGGVRLIREGKGQQIWCMYFAFVYENRRMKPVEIVVRRGRTEAE
jgi:hypothetical protein